MNVQGIITLLRLEVIRFKGVVWQTVFPSIVTNILYLLIIGMSIGNHVPMDSGITYLQFLAPGLIMMGMISNAYGGGSGSLFFQRFLGHITNLLSSPLKSFELIFAYLFGGVIRGIAAGLATWSVTLFFVGFYIHSYVLLLYFSFFVMVLFSALGVIIGLVVKDWEHLGAMSTFVITPLTFFGGVFHSVKMLPPLFQTLSLYNPFLYMVNGLRYAFIGVSDVDITISVIVIFVSTILMVTASIMLFNSGYNIKE